MNEIGFLPVEPSVLNVFINNEHIGVIRKVSEAYAFVPGKKRRTMSSEALRALAAKIEVMQRYGHG